MRVEDYEPLWLDNLCLAGKAQWRRRSRPSAKPPERRSGRHGPVRSTPIALVRRQHQSLWTALGRLHSPTPDPAASAQPSSAPETLASPAALRVLEYLQERGASFFDEIASDTGLLHTQLEACLAELVSLGAVSSDNFLGLRALLVPANKKKSPGSRRRTVDFGLEDAGRWSALEDCRTPNAAESRAAGSEADGPPPHAFSDDDLEALAWILLRRWGVLFRRLMDRETGMPPWRDLLRVLRRLEARGEIRGGRFVNRFSGEQFALPEAIPALRKQRKTPDEVTWLSWSAADPLNLVGILTPGARVPSVAGNRVLYRDGAPVATMIGGKVHFLEEFDAAQSWDVEKRLLRRIPVTTPEEEPELPSALGHTA